MKLNKYLPFILLGVGLLVVLAVYFLVFKKSSDKAAPEETALIEVALPDRPYVTLSPKEDVSKNFGHWLHLRIEKLKVPGAVSLDYELLYNLQNGQPQGVPGTVILSGQNLIERDLLLGSESSGKFRYDEGVTNGTLTLRFRNEKGKLLVKFVSDFHMQNSEKVLTSKDGKFTYTLDKAPTKTFFVTMSSFGVPGELPTGTVSGDPYVVTSHLKSALSGSVTLNGNINRWNGTSWQSLDSGKSADLGLFVGTSQ